MNVRDAIVTSARQLGYESVKDKQLTCISDFVSGKDVIVSLPTGYGKTMCYTCLPMVFDLLHQCKSPFSIVLVISPLNALMSDQVMTLQSKGVRAVKLSACSDDVETGITEEVATGKYQVLFSSPESIFSKEWRDVFQSSTFKERLVGIVVDEAHCIQKWYVAIRVAYGYATVHLCS